MHPSDDTSDPERTTPRDDAADAGHATPRDDVAGNAPVMPRDDAADVSPGAARELPRREGDRRARPTPWMSRYWLTGRRRGPRREDDSRETYVDRYERREWVLVVGIVVACVLDLLLTLDYLDQGGEEWNPLMARALEHGTGAFIALKMGLTAGCLLFLLVRIRFRGVRRAVQLLLVAYLLLMGWHGVVRLGLPDTTSVAAESLSRGAGSKSP